MRDGRGSALGFPFDTPNEPAPIIPAPLAGWIEHRVEGFLDVDQYGEASAIHTIGLRLDGAWSRWDFDAEAAYQHNEANNSVKRFFSPDPNSRLDGLSVWPFAGPYGEDDASFDAYAARIELGYTFDGVWAPRFFGGLAWFQGHDNRRNTFAEWFRNLLPYFTQDASVGVQPAVQRC